MADWMRSLRPGAIALCAAVLVLLVLPASALALMSTGDGGWQWLDAQPQGNDLETVVALDAQHAVAADTTARCSRPPMAAARGTKESLASLGQTSSNSLPDDAGRLGPGGPSERNKRISCTPPTAARLGPSRHLARGTQSTSSTPTTAGCWPAMSGPRPTAAPPGSATAWPAGFSSIDFVDAATAGRPARPRSGMIPMRVPRAPSS